MLTAILVVIEIISALALIILILLHSGKGGGMSELLGGSVGASAAGSTVAERNLDRITITFALVFMFSAVALSLRI
ncbi:MULTISPECIES: preprotein translocase subunit SecG [Acidithrix]|uniref:Protein-export membrane protein SecG n=1 Tax=Acidithrix ferrooxidans TaxID=1280514 RepID=A0A0D8HK36_9ACTN|nr:MULTISPECIES: preprotein translocase subunit SecG [Acidithrix]KJF18239.1 preprotein translocase subunit SecG [Acidithrix ferrooxidans]